MKTNVKKRHRVPTLRPPTRTVAENQDGDRMECEQRPDPLGPAQTLPERGWWIGFEWATWGWVALCLVVAVFGLIWLAFGWGIAMSLAVACVLLLLITPVEGGDH